jgi:hypothetical protein
MCGDQLLQESKKWYTDRMIETLDDTGRQVMPTGHNSGHLTPQSEIRHIEKDDESNLNL